MRITLFLLIRFILVVEVLYRMLSIIVWLKNKIEFATKPTNACNCLLQHITLQTPKNHTTFCWIAANVTLAYRIYWMKIDKGRFYFNRMRIFSYFTIATAIVLKVKAQLIISETKHCFLDNVKLVIANRYNIPRAHIHIFGAERRWAKIKMPWKLSSMPLWILHRMCNWLLN